MHNPSARPATCTHCTGLHSYHVALVNSRSAQFETRSQEAQVGQSGWADGGEVFRWEACSV